MITNLTSVQLRKAADLQDQISNLQSELNALLSGQTQPTPTAVASIGVTRNANGKRVLSDEVKARIAAGQAARWAKARAAAQSVIATPVAIETVATTVETAEPVSAPVAV